MLLALEKGSINPNDFEAMHDRRKLCLDRAYRHQRSGELNLSGPSSYNTQSNRSQNTDKAAPGVLLRVCKHFNEGKCNFSKEHAKGAYLWTHICSFCWHRLKVKRFHAEKDCEAKKKDPKDVGKNEKGGT